MRTLTVMLLVLIASSVAFAGDWQETVGTIAQTYQVLKGARSAEPGEQAPYVPPATIQPLCGPGGKTIRAIVSRPTAESIGGYSWGQEESIGLVEERFLAVAPQLGRRLGIQFLERKQLQALVEEQERANDPAMNPGTFEPMGQGLGANVALVPTILRMTAEDQEINVDARNWGRGARYRECRVVITVWLQLRVNRVGLYTIETPAIAKRQVTIVISREGEANGRWWMPQLGVRDRNNAVLSALYQLTDNAVTELVYKVLPQIRQAVGESEATVQGLSSQRVQVGSCFIILPEIQQGRTCDTTLAVGSCLVLYQEAAGGRNVIGKYRVESLVPLKAVSVEKYAEPASSGRLYVEVAR